VRTLFHALSRVTTERPHPDQAYLRPMRALHQPQTTQVKRVTLISVVLDTLCRWSMKSPSRFLSESTGAYILSRFFTRQQRTIPSSPSVYMCNACSTPATNHPGKKSCLYFSCAGYPLPVVHERFNYIFERVPRCVHSSTLLHVSKENDPIIVKRIYVQRVLYTSHKPPR
jgi:hypothetical protein